MVLGVERYLGEVGRRNGLHLGTFRGPLAHSPGQVHAPTEGKRPTDRRQVSSRRQVREARPLSVRPGGQGEVSDGGCRSGAASSRSRGSSARAACSTVSASGHVVLLEAPALAADGVVVSPRCTGVPRRRRAARASPLPGGGQRADHAPWTRRRSSRRPGDRRGVLDGPGDAYLELVVGLAVSPARAAGRARRPRGRARARRCGRDRPRSRHRSPTGPPVPPPQPQQGRRRRRGLAGARRRSDATMASMRKRASSARALGLRRPVAFRRWSSWPCQRPARLASVSPWRTQSSVGILARRIPCRRGSRSPRATRARHRW